ncbi:outer membrane beta-barrel protein [Oxalobacteraceae bacterium]|nr:outer membrane beta-barrel protein [Oxalobacteraceae bacterium]
MKTVLISTLFAAATMLVLPAHAEGFAVGVSIGPAHSGEIFVGEGSEQVHVNSSKGERPYKLFAGYDFTSNYGVEAGYLGGSGATTFNLPAAVGQIKIKQSGGYVALKGTLPLGERWSLFGKLGAGLARATIDAAGGGTRTERKESLGGMYASAGAAFAFNANLALQLELEHLPKVKIGGMKMGTDQFSLGLRYAF